MKRKMAVLIALAIVFLSVSAVSSSLAGEPLTQEEEALIRSFLINVMGWTNVTSITNEVDWYYWANGTINGCAITARLAFENEITSAYELQSAPSLPDKSVEECLGIAKNAVKAYGELVGYSLYNFNYSVSELFASMVPSTFSGNITIEKERMGLRIEATQKGYLFRWGYCKFGNYIIEGVPRIIEISMAKNGLITYFGYYDKYVASWEVNISKETALAIARTYAEEYAQNHSRKIASEKARLILFTGRENDSNACCPGWTITFTFDEIIPIDDYTGVLGYTVYMWADNGEIFNNTPIPTPSGGIDEYLKPKSSPYTVLLIVVPLGIATVMLSVGMHKIRGRNKALAKTVSLLPNKLQQTLKKAFA